MGTGNLDNRPSLTMRTARRVALMVLFLFCTSTANRCPAVGFGLSENNSDFGSDEPLSLSDNTAEDPNRDLDQDELNSNQQDSNQQDSDQQDSDDPDGAADRIAAAAAVPEVIDGRFRLPPLGVTTIATEQIGNGREPENFWKGKQGNMQPLPESGDDRGSQWNWSYMNWTAANTFSFPLYFEDRMLERHGHLQLGRLQSFAAGARFFATVPMMPYLMAVSDPHDCEYKLGNYRTGSCAPVVIQRPPLDRRAVVAEVLTMGGIIAIFP